MHKDAVTVLTYDTVECDCTPCDWVLRCPKIDGMYMSCGEGLDWAFGLGLPPDARYICPASGITRIIPRSEAVKFWRDAGFKVVGDGIDESAEDTHTKRNTSVKDIIYKPFDIVTDADGNVGMITEVAPVPDAGSSYYPAKYSVVWLVGEGEYEAWYDEDDLTVHCNMAVVLAESMCHPAGGNAAFVREILL